jgi:hypothetical protein
MGKSLGKGFGATLPPIPVKEAKLAVWVPRTLRDDVELFGTFFEELAGEAPASSSAIYVGILSAYLGNHAEFQQWKADRRAARTRVEGVSVVTGEPSGSQALEAPAVAA